MEEREMRYGVGAGLPGSGEQGAAGCALDQGQDFGASGV